jgi:hypothetical protein
MTRKKAKTPARQALTTSAPARQALAMLTLGYDAQWVALWLWHSSRIEAGISPDLAVPESLRRV